MHQYPSRRVFLRTATLATTLIPTVSVWSATSTQAASTRPVRLGIIGTGSRGRDYIRQTLNCPDGRAIATVSAICDTDSDAIRQTLALFDALGRPRPVVYSTNEYAFRQLLQRDDLDGVVIAASDKWQANMAVTAMKSGKHVGMSVSAVATVDESWALVDAFDQTGTPCMLLESTCYRPDVLAVLGQIRQGDFGEMTYARSGYQQATGRGIPYPTHGLGPVAHWLSINRGNRFISLSSTASKSRGLRPTLLEKGETSPSGTNYTLGDVITTTIQCANGATVELIHDSGTPRPYASGLRLQGTAGGWTGGEQTGSESANKADALMMYEFIESVRNRSMPPIDVYDAALWPSIHLLAKQSLAAGGQSVAIPDFTRGNWQTNLPIFNPVKAGAGV